MNKKVLAIIFIALLIVICLATFMLLASPRRSNTNISTNTQVSVTPNTIDNTEKVNVTNSTPSAQKNNTPTISDNLIPNDWQTYHSSTFELSYPSDWTVTDQSVGGNISIKFSPLPNGYFDPIAPSLSIAVVSESKASLSSLEMDSMGGHGTIHPAVTPAIIDSHRVDSTSFNSPAPVVNGMSYGTLTTKNYYISSRGNSNLIVTQFSSADSRSKDRNIIASILNSLKFH